MAPKKPKEVKTWEIIMLLCFAAFLWISQSSANAEVATMLSKGKTTTATVTEMYAKDRINTATIVEFDLNGKHIRAELAHKQETYAVGEKINVLYDPANAYKVMPANVHTVINLYVVSVLCALLAMLGIVFKRAGIKV